MCEETNCAFVVRLCPYFHVGSFQKLTVACQIAPTAGVTQGTALVPLIFLLRCHGLIRLPQGDHCCRPNPAKVKAWSELRLEAEIVDTSPPPRHEPPPTRALPRTHRRPPPHPPPPAAAEGGASSKTPPEEPEKVVPAEGKPAGESAKGSDRKFRWPGVLSIHSDRNNRHVTQSRDPHNGKTKIFTSDSISRKPFLQTNLRRLLLLVPATHRRLHFCFYHRI